MSYSNYPDGTTSEDIDRFEGAPTWFEYFIEEVAPEGVEIADLWSDWRTWSNWHDGDVEDWWNTVDESKFEEYAA